MSVFSQAGKQLLKKILPSTANYLTGNIANQEDDVNDVVTNEVMSGGQTGLDESSLVPATENQKKQSSFMNSLNKGLEIATDVSKYANLGTYLDAGADALSNLSSTINNQATEQTSGQVAEQKKPIEFIAPTIGEVNTGDNSLGIHINETEIKNDEQEEEEDSNLLSTIKKKAKWAEDWAETALDYAGLAFYSRDKIGSKVLEGEIADDYNTDLIGAVQYYNAVQEGIIPQSEYNAYLEEFFEKYDAPLKEAILKYGVSTKGDRKASMEQDINDLIKVSKFQDRLYELHPEWEAEEEEKTKQINTALSQSMDKINNAVKYSNLGNNAQEFVNDSYAVLQDQYSRMTNAIAPARRIKLNLINIYGTADTSQYTEKDKQIMDYINKVELAYATFVSNYGDRIASYVQFASPTDGRLIIPDTVDGIGLHDAVFKNTDFLTDGDFGESMIFGKSSASAIDVLETMSANIANEYSQAHYGRGRRTWTTTQRYLRPVGAFVNELGQQSLGRVGVGLYNLTSSLVNINNGGNFGRISFDALNEDNTLLSTLNTNNSQTGRILQKYVAGFMEYSPEIVGNVIDTFFLGGLPTKLRNANKFRVLLNKGASIWKPIQQAVKEGKSVKEVFDALAKGEKVVAEITDKGEKVYEGLNKLNRGQRFWRYAVSDAIPELVWDQVIDATLSSADNDFGSNASMVFSLGGTALGTLSAKLAEAGLFQMGKNGLNMIKEAAQNGRVKTTWMDGTVWKVLDTLEDENIDALVKSAYNLNSSQLATWAELKSFTRDFKTVSDTIKAALGTLTPEQQQKVTQAIKGKMGDQLKNLINQVYGRDSQFSRRIAQLIRDDRTNPADIFKYALGVNGTVEIGGWKSRISLADSPDVYVHGYNERLDILPGMSQTGFGKKLRDGFTEGDLKDLAESGVSWAQNWSESGYFKQVGDRYRFTKKGLDAANDIRTSSLDVTVLAKSTESAEQFDNLMKNNKLKKIDDKTLQDIKDSGAYDTLADALGEIGWLCEIQV